MANHDNYVIQGNTLDAIASEVKTLVDISDKISPNEMSEKLGQVNTDVETQADLIAQIQTALEGKAAGGGGNWYDFTVELTSDVANGEELLNVLVPYLFNVRAGKDIVICTLENTDVQPISTSGIAIQCYIYKGSDDKFRGYVSRYRSQGALVNNLAAMGSSTSCVALAGYKYFVKVVNTLA